MKSCFYLITVPQDGKQIKFITDNLINVTGKYPLFFVEKIDFISVIDELSVS